MQHRWDFSTLGSLGDACVEQENPVCCQPCVVHQIILDAGGSRAAQASQKGGAALSAAKDCLPQLSRSNVLVEVLPFGGRLLLQAAAIDAFQHGGFFVFTDFKHCR